MSFNLRRQSLTKTSMDRAMQARCLESSATSITRAIPAISSSTSYLQEDLRCCSPYSCTRNQTLLHRDLPPSRKLILYLDFNYRSDFARSKDNGLGLRRRKSSVCGGNLQRETSSAFTEDDKNSRHGTSNIKPVNLCSRIKEIKFLVKETDEPSSQDSTYSGRELDGQERIKYSDGNKSPIPLDSDNSRVGNFGGDSVQWWQKFVGSINPRLRGIILLNLLTFLYGSNIAVIKESEELLDPASFSVGRFVISALAFAPFMKGAFNDPYVAKAGLELGVWASIGYLTQAIGLMTTNAGRASFISTFTVIVVPLFAGFLGEKIPILTWVAATAALVGVGLLESSGTPPSVGDAWNLASAVIFGVHMLRTEYHSRSFSRGKALPIIGLQLSVITVSSFIWSLCSHVSAGDSVPDLLSLDWPVLWQTTLELPWFPMVYTGLISTAFCLWSELVAMRYVSATEAAVIYTLEPLWGAGFAWFLLGERWGFRGWLGASFILGGSMVTQIWGSPEIPVKPLKTPVPRVEASCLDSKELVNPLLKEACEVDDIDDIDERKPRLKSESEVFKN